jgi:hypothetical protein
MTQVNGQPMAFGNLARLDLVNPSASGLWAQWATLWDRPLDGPLDGLWDKAMGQSVGVGMASHLLRWQGCH